MAWVAHSWRIFNNLLSVMLAITSGSSGGFKINARQVGQRKDDLNLMSRHSSWKKWPHLYSFRTVSPFLISRLQIVHLKRFSVLSAVSDLMAAISFQKYERLTKTWAEIFSSWLAISYGNCAWTKRLSQIEVFIWGLNRSGTPFLGVRSSGATVRLEWAQ